MERRKYAPHVMLARARVATDVSGRLAELWEYAGPVWEASTLRLVRSTIGSAVHHETLAQWPLAAAPD
jgi:2'-5' RNA ligase